MVLHTVKIPLQFWFCRNTGRALPLIALQYHEVKLRVKMKTLTGVTFQKMRVFGDFIYLGEDERKRFSETKHEYIIDQVQSIDQRPFEVSSSKNKFDLREFRHPVKTLLWTLKSDPSTYNYLEHGETELIMNGQDRFEKRDGRYFSLVQPYQHATNVPTTPIHMYSFALKPFESQQSGSCNMSRIGRTTLAIKADPAFPNQFISIYAFGTNVLRIESGMGGLAFSN